MIYYWLNLAALVLLLIQQYRQYREIRQQERVINACATIVGKAYAQTLENQLAIHHMLGHPPND